MPFSDLLRLRCKHVSTKSLAIILCLLVVFPPSAYSANSPESGTLSDAIQKNTDSNRLQDTKLDLMLKMASRALMSEEDRKKAEEEEKRLIEEAKERIENPPEEFDTPLGKETRGKLKEIVDNTPILGAESTQEDVDKAQAQLAKAAAISAVARKQSIEEYHKALHSLPKELINALAEPLVTKEKIAAEPMLDDMLVFLNPSLDPTDMTKEEKAEYIFNNYTNQGVASSELIAAYHRTDRLVGILEENGHKLTDGAKKLLEDVGEKAEQAVDVHRAGADFAEFGSQMMAAAMMTGNPYVMAAMAAMIILMAILEMIFGGGGGDGDGDGDGPSDGKGEGSEGRNKNGANAGQNPPGAEVTTTDPRPGGEGEGNPNGELERVVDNEPGEIDRTSVKSFGAAEGPFAYTCDANTVFTFFPNEDRYMNDSSMDVTFDPKSVDVDPDKIEKLVSIGGSPKACVVELVVGGTPTIAYSKDQGKTWFVPPPPKDGKTRSTEFVIDGSDITLFPSDSSPFTIDLGGVEGAEGVKLEDKINDVAPNFTTERVRLRLNGVDVELELNDGKWTATEKGIAEK